MRPDPALDLDLPEPWTLRLFRGREILFASQRHWLHPLFDLDAFLAQGTCDPAGLRLVDRITGRAAAFLIARLGIHEVHTRLLSRRALPILVRYDIQCRCLEVVDRVDCATEDLLADVGDLEAAWTLLQERRARAAARLSAAVPGPPPAAGGRR